MATVRTRGDVLDARFDNLSVAFQPLGAGDGATRTIDFQLDGNHAAAGVRIDIASDIGQYTLREEFEPGWSVTAVSGDGQSAAPGALVWENVTARTLSYRLSRDDAYFTGAATIAGRLQADDLEYSISGDSEIGGGVTPFVNEVLATPSFRMGSGLNGCTVRPENVEGPWIGECLGLNDATIIPAEGLLFRPTFGTRWSQASGLDERLSVAARRRFWSNAADPQSSQAVLAKVETDI